MSPPKTLTAEQELVLIDNLTNNHGTKKQHVKACRNGCMAVVMLETGIRVAELCGLRIDDLWFAGQPVEFLIVRAEIAKNKKERQIPISRKLSELITGMESILWSPKDAPSTSYAFFATDPAKPLTTRSVERVIKSAGKSAFGIVVTPHMLRHTFGTRMMRKTNSRIVQELMGHDSLTSTQIYMHPNSEDLKKAIDGD